MKKLIAILLSFTFVLSVSAFASTTLKTDSRPVTATFQAANDSTIYSVDITWGSMNFIYAKKSQGTWDPTTHGYTGAVEEGWYYPIDASTGLAANEVRISNHSNAEVTYELSFSPSNDFNATNIQYSINESLNTLSSAEGTNADNPPSKIASLILSGENPYEESDFSLGSITVKVNDQ